MKNAADIIKESKYVINLLKIKEKSLSFFSNKNQIEIEIGMGKGNFLIKKAKKNPNINYIGIEKFDSVLVRSVEKLEKMEEELPNLKLMLIDAKELTQIFKNEVSRIYLNFSDPWPKRKHIERRLTSPTFLKVYESICKDIVNIEMKTDNADLFNYSVKSFLKNGYTEKNKNLNYGENLNNIYKTEYEEKFIKQNKPIYYISVFKKI